MKNLITLVTVIVFFSCKKENIYRDKLIEFINQDTEFINSYVVNKKLYLSDKYESYPEQYKIIIEKEKVLDSILKSFSHKISNTKQENKLEGIITDEINNLKNQIPKVSHHILQNLVTINNQYDYEFYVYQKIINYEILKTKYNIYNALSSGRSTRCWGGGRMTSYIKTRRKNDSIVTITLSSAFVKNNMELFEEGFFHISKLRTNKNANLKIVSEKRIFDVFSFDILHKSDEAINTKIDLFTSEENERNIFETLDTNIKVNETKYFSPIPSEYK